MNKYKASKYNYITEQTDKVYIYNTLHRSFISLQKNLWEEFCNGNSDSFTVSEYIALQRNGIVLPESIEELYLFRDIMQSSCLQDDEISLSRCCGSCFWQRERRRRILGMGNSSWVHGKIVLSAPRSETFGIGTGGCR